MFSQVYDCDMFGKLLSTPFFPLLNLLDTVLHGDSSFAYQAGIGIIKSVVQSEALYQLK